MVRSAAEAKKARIRWEPAGSRRGSGLSVSQLVKASALPKRRITALERSDDVPTDHELGVLAQACGVSVFDLVPAGHNLRVLLHDTAVGTSEANGEAALDALLREYLSMVVELRPRQTWSRRRRCGTTISPCSPRTSAVRQQRSRLGSSNSSAVRPAMPARSGR